MEQLRRIIGTAGPAPDAINRSTDWASFGDALWKDLKAKHNLKVSKQMHDAKKEGGGVLGIWKSLFSDAAHALESGPFARKQSQSFGGGSSTQAHQRPICVPMQTNFCHYQYPWYGYGPWYGNGVCAQVDLKKES